MNYYILNRNSKYFLEMRIDSFQENKKYRFWKLNNRAKYKNINGNSSYWIVFLEVPFEK